MSQFPIKKRMLAICCTLFLILFAFGGCSSEMITTDTPHLNPENTYGYYFDFYTSESKPNERNGVIQLDSHDDEMIFEVESTGGERELVVQIFVDYRQVPIIVGGVEHYTFFIEASDNYAEAIPFHLAEPLDTSSNHTLLAVLTAGSNVITSLEDFAMTNSYSIALDHVLVFDIDNPLYEARPEYEQTQLVTEFQSVGLLLNGDIENRKRKLEREITVIAGEAFQLQYQAGGYDDCEEMAIIISIGVEQTAINGQDYILCKVENGELVSGIATLNAPAEVGLYEVTGWIVCDPFDTDKSEFLPLDAAYRFTLNVI